MAVKRSCKKGKGMKIDIAKQLAKCGADIYKIVNANKGGSVYDIFGNPINRGKPRNWTPKPPIGPYYPKKGGIIMNRETMDSRIREALWRKNYL